MQDDDQVIFFGQRMPQDWADMLEQSGASSGYGPTIAAFAVANGVFGGPEFNFSE